MMEIVLKLVVKKIHVTKRDLYYTYPDLFSNQKISDEGIENLASFLQVPRNKLQIVASSKVYQSPSPITNFFTKRSKKRG